MSDRNNSQMDNEHLEEDLLNTIVELENGLNSIDNSMSINTPNLDWFEHIVIEQKQQLRKRLVRDITLFLVMAMLIVSGVLFTLSQLPVVFFVLQAVVTVFIAGYSTISFIKQVNES